MRRSLPDGLAALIGLLFPSGIALALQCTVALVGLSFATLGLTLPGAVAIFLLAHAFFIVTLTDLGMRSLMRQGTTLRGSFRIGALGGAVLSLPILLFWLAGQWRPIADLPWLVIGWVAVTGLALPARIVARLRRRRFVALPWRQQLPVALPCLALVMLTAWPTQSLEGEGWGLFEGGMILFPLLGLGLFLASFTCALLSALTARAQTAA